MKVNKLNISIIGGNEDIKFDNIIYNSGKKEYYNTFRIYIDRSQFGIEITKMGNF